MHEAGFLTCDFLVNSRIAVKKEEDGRVFVLIIFVFLCWGLVFGKC